MAPAGAVAAGRLLARLPRRDLALAAAAVVLALRVPGDPAEGRITTHPALVTSVQGLAGEVPAADTIIIPERHILYMAAWYTRARVSLRPEPIPPARRWRAMPLAFIGVGSELDRALTAARTAPALRPPLGLHPRHPNGFVLVAEPTWAWIVERLSPRARWRAWPTI